MDAAHLHMEIVNRRRDADEAYSRCVRVLDLAGELPGQDNDQGDRSSLDVARALGREIKDMIWQAAGDDYGMTDGDTELAGSLFAVFLGHIPDEALGDQFYRSTRERYTG